MMKGFSMKLGAGAPAAAAKKPEPKKAPAGLSIFAESMEEEENVEKERIKQGFHPRVKISSGTSKQLEEQMDTIAKEDPTAFQFDELLAEDEDACLAKAKSKVQTEGLDQKKRVGLFIPTGGPNDGKKSQYIQKLEKVREFREMEKEIVEQKVINRERKKEKNLYGEKDVFVTSAYKERLKERDSFLKAQKAKDEEDEARDAGKMEHGMGFAAFHRTLLDSACDTKPVPSSSSRASASAPDQKTAAASQPSASSSSPAPTPRVAGAEDDRTNDDNDSQKEETRREKGGLLPSASASSSLPTSRANDDAREGSAKKEGDREGKGEKKDKVKDKDKDKEPRVVDEALVKMIEEDISGDNEGGSSSIRKRPLNDDVDEDEAEGEQRSKVRKRSEVEERALQVESRSRVGQEGVSKKDREGKAQSAKERYLARKRMQAEGMTE